MKYMLLIYNRPGFAESLSDEDRAAVFAEVDELLAEMTEAGEFVGGQGLAHPSTAQTIRLQEDQVVVTDGPFVESREQFGGYCMIDCEGRDRALDIARRWPDVRFGGAIEVRAVMDEAAEEL